MRHLGLNWGSMFFGKRKKSDFSQTPMPRPNSLRWNPISPQAVKCESWPFTYFYIPPATLGAPLIKKNIKVAGSPPPPKKHCIMGNSAFSLDCIFDTQIGKRTKEKSQSCGIDLYADLAVPLVKLSSLGLLVKLIFGFQILSNVRIKPYP